MTLKKMKAKDKQSCCRKSAASSAAVGGIGKGHWNVSEVALGGHILRNVLSNLARASSSIPLLLFSQLQLCTGKFGTINSFVLYSDTCTVSVSGP